MKRLSTFLLYAAAAALFQTATAPNAFADAILGTNLATFAVLGAQTVTNTNPATNPPLGLPTTIEGNVGVWATPVAANDVTGLLATQVTGTIFEGAALGTTTQALAQTQLDIALGLLADLAPTGGTILNGVLDGLTLIQGVYAVSAAPDFGGFNLSGGTLKLDAEGASNPFWVFQMSSTLKTLSDSVVTFINTGVGFNPGLYWAVGSSATLGTDTEFQGNILALTSITLNRGATIDCGSALAANGSVTMDTNTITTGCNGSLSVIDDGGGPVVIGPGPGPGGTGGTPLPTPEPGTLLLLGTGIAGLVARRPRWARGRQRDQAPKA